MTACILRINMTDLTYRVEAIPEACKHLGGRGVFPVRLREKFCIGG